MISLLNDQSLPPDNFPPGWDDSLVDVKSDEQIVAPVNEAQDVIRPSEELVVAESKVDEYIVDKGNDKKVETGKSKEPLVIDSKQASNVSAPVEAAAAPLPSDDVNPIEMLVDVKEEKPESRKNAPNKMITVVVRHSGDQARDNLRLRRIHGLLISYPGKDRFAFYVVEGSNGYQLEFPNDSTNISSELLKRLEHIVGAENVITEEITYQ
jgi:DNA polymerase-3 subunit alpha